ncbi:MAG: Flp pilus assembly complex ATPase component TadA [Candidatus Riflebacteria bacterium]|nr:Flp pilus assembly complex ATPase component TadA [Candidatus Riflebacteria bacterium]
MNTQKKRLGDILIDCNLITDEQLKQALTFQRDKGIKLGEALSEMNLVTEDDIIWALGNQLNISFIHLNPDIVDTEVVKMVAPEFARDHKLMPLYKAGNQFSVCMVDPLDSRPIEFLEGKFGVQLSVSICTAFDFETTYSAIYGPVDVQQKVASGDIDSSEKQSLERGIPKGMESPEKVINYILGQAIINKVNRIHFEPSDKGVVIRFRTNNVLSRKVEVPVKLHHEIIGRLKKLSQLTEKDMQREGVVIGHFRVTVSSRQINIQSIFFPTVNGEMVILKLSDFNSILEQLGKAGKAAIEELVTSIKTTHGVLYVSGPRESGRTTTQYCILNSYDAETRKLIAIEDPVVATLSQVTQIQVGSGGIDNSLAGLKLALQLDADIIYLDHLGSKELAEEVSFAGLGGKTVLTSYLAHDASSSIIKLLETGADPVIVASSLCGFVCQRLIRVLCPNCKREADIPQAMVELVPEDSKDKKIFAQKGCEGCNNTGYIGKSLITEYLPATPTLRQMIVNRQNYQDFNSFARKQGIVSLEDKALAMVLAGETSADEFMRLF